MYSPSPRSHLTVMFRFHSWGSWQRCHRTAAWADWQEIHRMGAHTVLSPPLHCRSRRSAWGVCFQKLQAAVRDHQTPSFAAFCSLTLACWPWQERKSCKRHREPCPVDDRHTDPPWRTQPAVTLC